MVETPSNSELLIGRDTYYCTPGCTLNSREGRADRDLDTPLDSGSILDSPDQPEDNGEALLVCC